MFKKIRRYLRNPYYALGYDLLKSHPKWMSDKYFIKVFWKQMMGYPLDLKHPKTFNEKIQWMKLYDRNPRYTDLVDKLKVKDWVANKIGREFIIPTLAVYNNVDDIRLEDLPEQFVLKCNHDSGGIVICEDKSTFDLEAAKRKLKKCIEHNFYWDYRDWAYKNIERKFFAEQYIEPNTADGLADYKFFCFNGTPQYMYVANGRQTYDEVTFDFFDMQFNWIDVNNSHPNATCRISKPLSFELMKKNAAILSEGFNQVRVDFYESDGMCLFGEMTFYHCAGFAAFKPFDFDREMGNLFCVPEKSC